MNEEKQQWRVYALRDGGYTWSRQWAHSAEEACAEFDVSFTHLRACCAEPEAGLITMTDDAYNAERVALILGRQKPADAPGPRQPKPALPVEVWRDTSTQPDYMAAVRSLCGGRKDIMKTEALKLVRRHFASDLVSREINRANARKWVASVRLLGDRWLLARPMGKA